MDNKTALVLAILIGAVFLADVLWFQWDLPVFLGKKLAAITEWMAFWR